MHNPQPTQLYLKHTRLVVSVNMKECFVFLITYIGYHEDLLKLNSVIYSTASCINFWQNWAILNNLYLEHTPYFKVSTLRLPRTWINANDSLISYVPTNPSDRQFLRFPGWEFPHPRGFLHRSPSQWPPTLSPESPRLRDPHLAEELFYLLPLPSAWVDCHWVQVQTHSVLTSSIYQRPVSDPVHLQPCLCWWTLE